MTILTVEQYNSTVALTYILEILGVKTAFKVRQDLIDDEGPNWEICNNCADIKADCDCGAQCEDDYDYDRWKDEQQERLINREAIAKTIDDDDDL